MRDSFLGCLLLPVALSIGACGGSISPVTAGTADAGGDANADSGACADGGYPVSCGAVVLYCCPPGAYCDPPSCGVPAAADAAAPDAGPCPPGEYLIFPCCGGYNDTTCSNGPGPPPPFCSALPSSCEGKSTCMLGGCIGPLDESKRTLGCTCI